MAKLITTTNPKVLSAKVWEICDKTMDKKFKATMIQKVGLRG